MLTARKMYVLLVNIPAVRHADQVWSLKDVAGPEAVIRDAESFPGPASSAPVESVKEYVEKRAAAGGEADGGAGREGKRLLWSVAGLALQFKVCMYIEA